ncbi:MAG: VWA domain-containing protein [Synergistaceae bacterium]|nr:VWA domain-containing protein [Synergistaceae bacterium]
MSGPGRRNVAVLLLAVVGLALSLPAFGAEGRLLVHQALLAEPPTATLFLEALDGKGALPVPIEGENLTVLWEGTSLPLARLEPFENSGEGTAFIFLVDISKSLRAPQLKLMKDALYRFISHMGSKDRAAFVTFGDAVTIRQDFTDRKDLLLQEVEHLQLTDMTTHLHGGLVQVQRLARRLDEDLPRRRVAVVLSDGKNEAVGGETEEEVLGSLAEEGIPLFALGFYAPPLGPMRPHLDQLKRFALASGGDYFPPDGPSMEAILAKLQQRLNLAWQATVDLSSLPFDGREVTLVVQLRHEGKLLSDSVRLRLWDGRPATSELTAEGGGGSALSAGAGSLEKGGGQVKTPPEEGAKKGEAWLWAVLLLALLLVAAFLLRRRRAPAPEPKGAGSREGIRSLELEIIREGQRREVFSVALGERLTLGRAVGNDVCLKGDLALSARHCEIGRDGDGLYVKDLKATNGTYLNDRRIDGTAPLKAGDVLRLGRTTVKIRQLSGEGGGS